MSMLHRLAGVLIAALVFVSPAMGFDLQSTTVPGRAPGVGGVGTLLSNGEIAINRADKRLIFKNVDGTLGYGALLDPTQPLPGQIANRDGGDFTVPVGSVARALKTKLAEAPSVMDAGAICDGTKDAGPTINAMIAVGVQQIAVPLGATCRSSVPVVVPGGVTLQGTAFHADNPSTGAKILCDAGVTPCVQVGKQATGSFPYAASLRRITVARAGGQPSNDKIGLLVLGGYNAVVEDVQAYNHGQCAVFKAAGSNGLSGMATRLFTGKCADAHLVQDTWPELRISQSRLGMNGGGDYAANTYIRVQGGVSGTAAGPNGLVVQNSQLNQGSVPVHHVIEFVNLAAPIPNVDATGFSFDNVHVENVDQAAIYSDATWNLISRSHISNSTLNFPGAAFFALNAATSFDDYALVGNHIYTSGMAVAPTAQINSLRVIGNFISGPVSLSTGGTGATATLASNSFGSGLALAGAWGQLNVIGSTYAGGSLTNNATGNVLIEDAANGIMISGSVPKKTIVLYGTTDASGNLAVPHGIASATARVIEVTTFVRDAGAGSAAILVPNTMGSGNSYTVVDGTNVNLVLTSTYASRRVRIAVTYQTETDPTW